jgi:hypothetical protein
MRRVMLAHHATHIRSNVNISWPPIAFVGLVAAVVLVLYLTFEHRRWQKGWLSGLIALRLSAARKRNTPKNRLERRIGWRSRFAAVRLAVIEFWDKVLGYFRDKFVVELRSPHLPSLVSFLLVVIFIAAFFIIPHAPSIPSGTSIQNVWHSLADELQSTSDKF